MAFFIVTGAVYRGNANGRGNSVGRLNVQIFNDIRTTNVYVAWSSIMASPSTKQSEKAYLRSTGHVRLND